MTPNGRPVRSVSTTLQIIEFLRDREETGVTELAESTNVSKTTAYHHLFTLCQNGYVIKEGDKYRLSLKFIGFGEHLKSRRDIYVNGRDEIKTMAEKSDAHTNIATEEDGLVYILHKERGQNAVATSSRVGQAMHLHCTSAGKAILSQLPAERVHEILDQHGMPSHTKRTVVDREELFEELAIAKESGAAAIVEEYVNGACAIAAPLSDRYGTVRGAISISGPTTRMLSAAKPTSEPKHEQFREDLQRLVAETSNLIEMKINMR